MNNNLSTPRSDNLRAGIQRRKIDGEIGLQCDAKIAKLKRKLLELTRKVLSQKQEAEGAAKNITMQIHSVQKLAESTFHHANEIQD